MFKIVISQRASKTFSSKKKNQDQAAFRNSWATKSEAIKGYALQFELLLNIPSEMPIDTYRQAQTGPNKDGFGAQLGSKRVE